MSDKNLIFKNAKNLKSYNESVKRESPTNPYVFITEHLPEKFQQQRKRLLDTYKEAKKNRQKAVWKVLDGNYTLFINDQQVEIWETDKLTENAWLSFWSNNPFSIYENKLKECLRLQWYKNCVTNISCC